MADVKDRILSVEDQPAFSLMVEAVLQDMGLREICSVSTLGDALRQLSQNVFSLVILDLQLGEENGLIVAEQCAQRDIPVVFSTGFGKEFVPVTYGSERVLRKPYSADELKSAVARVLHDLR